MAGNKCRRCVQAAVYPSNTVLATCLLVFPAVAGAQSNPPGTKPVPMEIQDKVEDNVAKFLVLPETAEWHFDFMAPYAGGGDVVCGSVNYQSLQRKFVGAHRFFVVIRRDKITLSQLQDPPEVDVSGQEAIKFKLLCDRH
jgi:hypothetical protein